MEKGRQGLAGPRRTTRRHRRWTATSLLIGVMMTAAIIPAGAVAKPAGSSPTVQFDIPPQDMKSALRDFARTAHVQLIYSAGELQGLQAPRIAGAYTPADALARLLGSSQLSYAWTGPNTIAIRPRPRLQPAAARMVVPPAMPRTALVAEQAQPADSPSATGAVVKEIIVTAQKREQSLQKVPISITAIGADDLEARGLSNVKELQVAVPGLQIPELSGIVMPFIRGVGSATNLLSNESSVAVYLDGVYHARLPSGMLDLSNMERVEVLKGPQGTLFGRNSTGGVINIVTSDPTFEPQVKGSLGYGRFEAIQGRIYGSTGLSETVAVDLAVSGKTDQGFGTVLETGGRYGFQDQVLVRSKLLFEPSEATKVSVSGFYSWTQQDGNKGFFPGTTVGTFSEPHVIVTDDGLDFHDNLVAVDDVRQKDWGVSLRAEQDLSFARLTSITAYTHTSEAVKYDIDRTERDDFNINTRGFSRVFTQELQLANLPGGKLDWVLGAFYYNNFARYTEESFISPLLFGPGFNAPAQQHALSYAGFAQATYEVLPRLRLTGGLRYTHEKTSAEGEMYLFTDPPTPLAAPPPDSNTENRVTFKASADYELTDRVLLYGSFSRGFKSGSYNTLTYSVAEPTKPETLDAWEIGMKGDFLDRRLRLNLAAFNYDLKSPQVQLMVDNVVIYSNGGGARMRGVELEGQAVLAPRLNARFNALYLDAKYTDYLNAPSNTVDPVNGGVLALPPIDAAGNRTPYAAKFTFGVGGDYTVDAGDGEITLTADYYHNSGHYFEPDNFLRQGPYDLLSGQIRYAPTENLAVRVWGKNLTGSEYAQLAVAAGPAAFIYRPAPPLTYGIAVDFNF